MIKRILLIAMLSIAATKSYHQGFTSNTLVLLDNDRLYALAFLEPADMIIGFNWCLTPMLVGIKRRTESLTSYALHFSLQEHSLVCGIHQMLYCANKEKWLEASQLTTQDSLLNAEGKPIEIMAISTITKPHVLIAVATDEPYSYAVSPLKILAHSMAG